MILHVASLNALFCGLKKRDAPMFTLYLITQTSSHHISKPFRQESMFGSPITAFLAFHDSFREPIRCPIIFDGRILRNTSLSDLDNPARSPYSTKYVKGENLTWASIIEFPCSKSMCYKSSSHGRTSPIPVSRFEDPRAHKPFAVTISNTSIFRAGGRLQTGFRRAGLLFRDDNNDEGTDPADSGVVTFHWSVRQDASKPLNLTHEYMNV
jgi:hypothetical protein